MGAQCNGTCYATNQYDADISVILDKTQYRRLKKEDVQSDKLELGPDKFADAQTRDAILRECPLSQVFDNEF